MSSDDEAYVPVLPTESLSTRRPNPQENSQIAESTENTTRRDVRNRDTSQDGAESAQPNIQGCIDYTEMDLFTSEENITRMETFLDTWSQNLKTNVLRELMDWRLALINQHRRELQKERDCRSSETEAYKAELERLKNLLHTSETNNKRKDEMIRNLNVVLNKQKQKLEKMSAFTKWKLQYSKAKEEAFTSKLAQQHYNLRLKRKAWLMWHSAYLKEWKARMEQACRAKAEEVCNRLSENYEARIQTITKEHNEALTKAHAEIERLQLEQEHKEVCMKKALMRGVCALNMETLHLFNPTDGEPQNHDGYDPNFPPNDPPPPHSSFPHGPGPGFHDQGGAGAGIRSQQKPTKSGTARSSTQHVGKSMRSNLEMPSVAPPMSSAPVDYHHLVTQQTLGQATASKYPRSSQHGATGGWSSSRMHTSTYPPPPWDEPDSAAMAQCPGSSPVHFDHPKSPTQHEDNSMMGVWYTREVFPSQSAAHGSLPQGAAISFHKQTTARIITAGHQKSAKTITARITAQPFAAKSVRSSCQVMGVSPSMSSIVVERHQPITQHTIAVTAKSVRPSQQGTRTCTVVKASSRTNPFNGHSIKVVD
ncbi:centrosomal protein POC5 isoform X2 [Syngnathus typhle]|uniref:centrosomal protein POC5 isoform X2 n=1 Tax=Syngnathus typhle TaxID=161592 RepID=UPI002A69CE93|nr:centrosomal protein POC5 isoform X2 [Syngnathus typhle]